MINQVMETVKETINAENILYYLLEANNNKLYCPILPFVALKGYNIIKSINNNIQRILSTM